MRRVLLNACLLMTAVSLSACHHDVKPDPAPVDPAPMQPAPAPAPAYVPPPQPAQPAQPPPGFHTAGQPNGTQPNGQPANTGAPSGFHSPNGTAPAPAPTPAMNAQQQDESYAASEAVAYAASHGLPNAQVGKVKMGTNNLWNVMLHGMVGSTEKRMHVFVVPNHGGVKTAAILAGPTAAGWNDEQMP